MSYVLSVFRKDLIVLFCIFFSLQASSSILPSINAPQISSGRISRCRSVVLSALGKAKHVITRTRSAFSREHPTVIIVDAISSGRDYAQKFRDRGFRVVHVRSQPKIIDPKRYQMSKSDFDDSFVYRDDLPRLLQSLNVYNNAIVVAGAEEGVLLAQDIAKNLKIDLRNKDELSHTWKDKFEALKYLREAGVDVAAFEKVKSWDALEAWALEHNKWPIVLKPLNSAGTHGVTFNYNLVELKASYDKYIGTKNPAGELNEYLLAMEYLEGAEYAVDVTMIDGKYVVSDVLDYKRKTRAGASTTYDYDLLIPFSEAEKWGLIRYAEKVVQTLGVQVGHLEIKITEKGPRLVEMAARPIGSSLPRIAELATGRSQITLMVDGLSRAESYRAQPEGYTLHKNAAAVFITSEGSKRLTLRALEKLRLLPGFVSCDFSFAEGEVLPRTIDADTTIGQVFLVHEDKAVLMDSLEKVREMRDRGDFEE